MTIATMQAQKATELATKIVTTVTVMVVRLMIAIRIGIAIRITIAIGITIATNNNRPSTSASPAVALYPARIADMRSAKSASFLSPTNFVKSILNDSVSNLSAELK